LVLKVPPALPELMVHLALLAQLVHKVPLGLMVLLAQLVLLVLQALKVLPEHKVQLALPVPLV
jgi:hypothetical protein